LLTKYQVVPSLALRAVGALALSWTCCLVRWCSGPYTKVKVRSELVLLVAVAALLVKTLHWVPESW
jgi:hypothetical protein